VLVDLTDRLIDVAGKFVTYALFPSSAYSVLVTRSKSKCKISIGYNPWSKRERTHDIASICERWGGGGHPVVGAISLPADQAAKAKEIAQTIAVELAT
jgi:nanoRNase/pAp phosphatase (c-di-AMP/oligoRNAs hydrolase)